MKQRDLQIPEVVSQNEWDAQLVRAFLSAGISFNAASNPHLRATWLMLKRNLMVPSPSTIRRRLDELYKSTVKTIKSQLPRNGKISLCLDSWTSPNHLAFLSIIGYFVTKDWELKELLLGFEDLPEGHSGQEQAEIVLACLQRYKIAVNIIFVKWKDPV